MPRHLVFSAIQSLAEVLIESAATARPISTCIWSNSRSIDGRSAVRVGFAYPRAMANRNAAKEVLRS